MGMCDRKENILLVIINTVTILVGLAVTLFGVLGLLQQGDVSEYTGGNDLSLICIGVLIVGVIILIVGLIGWVAGFKQNSTLAKGYVFLILLIVLLQLAFCLLGYLKRGSLKNSAESYLNETFNATAYSDLTEVNQEFVDLVQTNLECCGLTGSWVGDLPASCCSNGTVNGTAVACSDDSDLKYAGGCVAAAETFVVNHIMILVFVLAAGFILELICLVLGFLISRKISDYDRV